MIIFSHIAKTMGWPFTVVYTLLIIGTIYFTSVIIPNKLNSNGWPQVQGQVSSSETIQRQRRNKTGDEITVYSAKINYQYTVESNNYNNHAVMLADHHTGEHIQKSIGSKYTIGTTLTVFYNPVKPSISALEPGLSFESIITGLFFLISIGAMAFALYRNASNRK